MIISDNLRRQSIQPASPRSNWQSVSQFVRRSVRPSICGLSICQLAANLFPQSDESAEVLKKYHQTASSLYRSIMALVPAVVVVVLLVVMLVVAAAAASAAAAAAVRRWLREVLQGHGWQSKVFRWRCCNGAGQG